MGFLPDGYEVPTGGFIAEKNFTATMFKDLIEKYRKGERTMDIEETIVYLRKNYRLTDDKEIDIRQYFRYPN